MSNRVSEKSDATPGRGKSLVPFCNMCGSLSKQAL